MFIVEAVLTDVLSMVCCDDEQAASVRPMLFVVAEQFSASSSRSWRPARTMKR